MLLNRLLPLGILIASVAPAGAVHAAASQTEPAGSTPSTTTAQASASTDPAARSTTVRLKSGAVIEGRMLKQTDRRVWIDVGADVLSFAMDDVAAVESQDPSATVAIRTDSIFSTALGLAELPPREQAKRIGPAVIKVSTPGGLGSGVILSRDGYAITNAHVVQGETNLRATVWFAQPDGSLKRTDIDGVELVAINNQVDLALIKLKHPEEKDFLFAPVQDAELLEIGQNVFAIGNPLGLERTLTQGVVSTTQRNFDGLTYIQTDTPINPGNSGGPLFNTKGEVIGITNMGILGGEALGFAIPARYVKDFIRNREAFAYDRNNPNSGHNYQKPPRRTKDGAPPSLKDGTSGTAG
ncbi:MAG: trypsin-like peptidase domain-containing protein [Planctomycetaceae bacterium]|nr:trypsin-like peptidase domain-containing protein [Planctomycetaceae bacterium]